MPVQECAFEHGEAEAGSAKMSDECRRSVATMEQYCRDTVLFSVLAPCCIALACLLPGAEAGWGALRHALLHMKATALDASSLNWLYFRQKFSPLIKTCFTEHWVWPQKDTQAACFQVTRLQTQAFPLWKKSLEMACCSFQSVLVMGSRQHVTRDPRPIKAEKEQSSPSLLFMQSIQRNIYSTFTTLVLQKC